MLILEIRNPDDAITTFDTINIERGSQADGSDMAILDSVAIGTATVTDLSSGYTEYVDVSGDINSHYYRFRYSHSVTGDISNYSDVFKAGTTIFHVRFRRRMRDTNTSNQYFTDSDITSMLSNAVTKLYPSTYNEVIDETLVTDGVSRKYSFPTGVTRVNDIEFLNQNGDVAIFARNFSRRARQIIFDTRPPAGYTMRLYADRRFLKAAEVPATMDDLILDLMRLEAYETFEADRHKFYKYSTVVQPDGGNMPSIARVIERLITTTKDRLQDLRRIHRATDIKLI